jgi:hypothetical protein
MVLTISYKCNKPRLIQDKNKCYFCGGSHVCRECPQETLLAPVLKKFIGSIMEDFIGDTFSCPCCVKKTMYVLGNHSPSLDIVCQNCYRKFEVKSKCLSVTNIPKDINLPHGNYEDYNKRQSTGLDLFVIIYKVDRIHKKITIREVLYSKNSEILKNDNIKVVKRDRSHLSTICIKDRFLLTKMKLEKLCQFDFSSIIDKYLQTSEYLNKIQEMTV